MGFYKKIQNPVPTGLSVNLNMFQLAIVVAFFLMSVGAYPQTNEEKKVAIIPPWEQQCQDIADECATDKWKEMCDAPAYKDFMATNCAKTCKLCDASINDGIVDCKWSEWKNWGSCTKSC